MNNNTIKLENRLEKLLNNQDISETNKTLLQIYQRNLSDFKTQNIPVTAKLIKIYNDILNTIQKDI